MSMHGFFPLAHVFCQFNLQASRTKHERVEDRGPICFGVNLGKILLNMNTHKFKSSCLLLHALKSPIIGSTWPRCLVPQMRKTFKLWQLPPDPKLRNNLSRSKLSC